MAITKETVVDKIEILEMGSVQVRAATVIKKKMIMNLTVLFIDMF